MVTLGVFLPRPVVIPFSSPAGWDTDVTGGFTYLKNMDSYVTLLQSLARYIIVKINVA